MKYIVIVTPEAQVNITAAHAYIAERSPLNAEKWLRHLKKQIDALKEFPHRFGDARERRHLSEDLRQLIFKSHRIIFTIDDTLGTVRVVYVRHAKMRAVGERDASDDVDRSRRDSNVGE